jgi:hypothetical protein
VVRPWSGWLRCCGLRRRGCSGRCRHLCAVHLLPGEQACWHWPWEPAVGYLVRCCPLCAASREAVGEVWLVRPDPWRLCVRHCRFTECARTAPERGMDVCALPESVRAHRRRERLERRWGGGGRLPARGRLRDHRLVVAARPGCRAVARAGPARGVAAAEPGHGLAADLSGGRRLGPAAAAPRTGPRRAPDFRKGPRPWRAGWGSPPRCGTYPLAEWLARHHHLDEDTPTAAVTGPAPVRARAHTGDDAHGSLVDRGCLPWDWTDTAVPV